MIGVSEGGGRPQGLTTPLVVALTYCLIPSSGGAEVIPLCEAAPPSMRSFPHLPASFSYGEEVANEGTAGGGSPLVAEEVQPTCLYRGTGRAPNPSPHCFVRTNELLS